MPFVEGNFGEMTFEEYEQCLTQEQCDKLPRGTMIWFHNTMHQLTPERIAVAAGEKSKHWRLRDVATNAHLSDFFETPLYNVGKDDLGKDDGSNPDFIKGKQMVWLRAEEAEASAEELTEIAQEIS